MRFVAVIACALTLAVAGAAARQAGDPGVAKVRQAYQAAVAAQNAAAIAKLYAADGVEMPPNAPAQKGHAAIEAFHKNLATQWMVHGMTITSTESHVTGDYAIDSGTFKQTLMGMKTGAMVDDTGKYVAVLKKDAGGWSIATLIYNSDNPPPGTAAPKK